MSAPPIYLSAQEQERNVIPVEWRIGFTRPKGVAYILIPEGVPSALAPAIAELTAIRFLVESQQVGTSMRHHDVITGQAAIKELLAQESNNSLLIPYGRHLYLYVDQDRLSVGSTTWGKEVEIDPLRISVTTAAPAAWPEVFCPALRSKVGVTRHAMDRFIERGNLRKSHWHAFQAATKRLESPYMRVVPREEVEKTNPNMRMDARTVVLHHQASDTAWIVVKEDEGWVLVTMHPHFQEYVPTFVRGNIEYRRNI